VVDSSYLTANVTVYDQLGSSHDITVGLTRIALPGTAPAGAVSCWHWAAAGEGDLGTTGGAAVTTTSGGDLYFNSDGQLIADATPQTISVTPAAGGAPAFSVNMDLSAISQLAAESQFQASDQNGFPPGSLQSFSMSSDGVITGLYTNGLTRPLGQIATAIFPNSNGLERTGSNLWRATDNSGVPVVGTPKSGGRGAINSGYLEQSNVDIGSEFTDLIVTQRGFQANTKVVTTVDEMLQDLLAMKR
jgi:flagellar hook protein FlgE